MNNQRSSSEQLIQFLLMGFLVWYVFTHWNGGASAPTVAARPARPLIAAFAGLDPAKGPVLTTPQANAQVTALTALIAPNPADGLANWARLRIGLIQQYVLNDLKPGTTRGGFLGMGAEYKFYDPYNTIITSGQGDDIEAQAIYQEGDLLWRESTKGGAQASAAAEGVLDTLVHRGRGPSPFIADTIYVPVIKDPAKVPLIGYPPGGMVPVVVSSLHGSLAAPNPQGIIDRLNLYYQNDPFYKVFDFAVVHLGNNPAFSYGLAVLIFAAFTRTLMLPLTKKQYESMRGMALIGPEMKKIQDRYKGNTEQTAQMAMIKEIQALQKRHGVNPYLGCGLSLLQMPIFFLVVYPLIQHNEPKMELAGASFLWIRALAQPDYFLLFLYGISMLLSFRLSSTPPADETQRSQQMIMSVLMPVLFPFFIKSYPAAFTMYWMTFNVMSTIFQWKLIKKADPRKNVVRTLLGENLNVPGATETPPSSKAVPPRPGGKSGNRPSNDKTETNGKPSANGKTNADGKASPNGKANANGNANANGKASVNGKLPSTGNGSNGSVKARPGDEPGLTSAGQNGSAKSGKRKKG